MAPVGQPVRGGQPGNAGAEHGDPLRRRHRYRPATCQANLMHPLPLPRDHFDSAAMNLVFHTIPGGWEHSG